jgi:hypothetical protein
VFGSMNVNKKEKQLILFQPISSTVKNPDNIKGTMRAKNVEVNYPI